MLLTVKTLEGMTRPIVTVKSCLNPGFPKSFGVIVNILW